MCFPCGLCSRAHSLITWFIVPERETTPVSIVLFIWGNFPLGVFRNWWTFRRRAHMLLAISRLVLSSRTACNDGNVLYLCHPIWWPLGIYGYWVLGIWQVRSEKLNFSFYLILINWDLNNYILLVAILDSTVLEDSHCPLVEWVVSRLERGEHTGKSEKATRVGCRLGIPVTRLR